MEKMDKTQCNEGIIFMVEEMLYTENIIWDTKLSVASSSKIG